MSYLRKVFKWTRRHNIWTGIIILAFLYFGYSYLSGGKADSPYDFYAVDRGGVSQEVSTIGKVVPARQADLSFDKSGTVVGIYVNEGSYVFTGQELAKIDDSELKTQLSQAEADLAAQEIKLAQLKGGTRTEEIEIAENDLKNAYLPAPDILNDSRNKIEDALYKQVDPIFDNDDAAPQLTFTVSDTQLKTDSEAGRLTARDELLALKNEIIKLDFSDNAAVDKELTFAKGHLLKIGDFLSTFLKAVNMEANLSDSNVSTYKTNIGTARTNIQTAIESITTQEKAISSAKRDLALKQAGSMADDIKYQEVMVDKAKGQVDNIKAQLAKTIIVSPINAIVTKKNINVGEFSSAGTAAFSVISNSQMEAESNVPEADIAKIKKGNTAKITLDAYGPDEVFTARVVKINPGETVIEGVSTYKITLNFDSYSEKIKSGMTANIDIETNKKEGVIRAPQRAVSRDSNGNYSVKMMPIAAGEDPEMRKVEIGLRGSDGFMEIISGLAEGEKVITFEKK